MKKRCIGRCVTLPAESINRMVETARRVTLSEFLSEVHYPSCNHLLYKLGYGPAYPIERDQYVEFYRSTFEGQSCVFMVHSRIEYVFV